MCSPQLSRSCKNNSSLCDIKSYYTASTIHRAPSRYMQDNRSSYQSLPHIPISGSEGKMLLYKEVFMSNLPVPKSRSSKRLVKLSKKIKTTDFFYQLLAVESQDPGLPLKDLLCIAELGIPQGDLKEEASIAIAIGDRYEKLRKNLSALKFFQRALYDYKQLQDKAGESIVLNRLGIIYFNRGKLAKSRDMNKKHKAMCREDFIPYYNLGVVYRTMKLYLQSSRCFLKALTVANFKDNKEEICIANAQLGLTYKAMSDLELAKQRLLQAVKLAKLINAQEIMLEIKIALAYLTFHQGCKEESEKYFYAGMTGTIGMRSDVCRVNIGIMKGDEKLKAFVVAFQNVLQFNEI